MITGRMAPSPTGRIHLGNAISFLVNWLYVRSHRGKMILRIDDIDPHRSKPEFTLAIKEDLQWLGLDWDMEFYQSQNLECYAEALEKLRLANLVYSCFCTRKDLRSMASAPQIGDMGAPYAGICRNLSESEVREKLKSGKPACQRLRCSDRPYVFEDLIQGWQSFCSADVGGDFALVRSDGVFAYQLATTVDDAALGVNFVLRGRDLLCSTPRQLILFEYLGYKPPTFAHHPLLLDHSGERLAKRHKSLSLAQLRKAGLSPGLVVGYLAWMANILPNFQSISSADLAGRFCLDKLPKEDINLPANTARALEGLAKII